VAQVEIYPSGYALASNSAPKCVAGLTYARCFPESRSVGL